MEIPENISWKYQEKLPGARMLAEPGAGWWNNLFLVKRDGSLWIRLTSFTRREVNKGVLYPKFSRDGKMVAWAERVGGAKPFDRYPFARWVLKTARINVRARVPRLYNMKTHRLKDAAIVEPQEWSADGTILVAADTGYSHLPYPGYRLDLWEAQMDPQGNLKKLQNLSQTQGFYEEQASYSPDGKLIAFMANRFDTPYEQRLNHAYERHKARYNKFIVRNLTTDLYLMDRQGRVLSRLTRFADQPWQGYHPLMTRSAWGQDGKTLLLTLTLRHNVTGKKTEQAIYRMRLR